MNSVIDTVKMRGRDSGQALTEFVVVLPLFLILTFASLGLARLVYIRWQLEERSRFAIFSKAHGADPNALFNQHLLHRPKPPNYMKSVSFSSSSNSYGDLLDLIDSSSIPSPDRDDPIPATRLLPRQSSVRYYRKAGNSAFWDDVIKGEQDSYQTMHNFGHMVGTLIRSELAPLSSLRPYVGTRDALSDFENAAWRAWFNGLASADQICQHDKDFQKSMLDTNLNSGFLNVRDNFTLSGAFGPKRSYVGAFQGAMRNVLSVDNGLIDSEINNSVFHSAVTVSGLGSALRTLPLRGMADSSLTSNLYIVSGAWDINRQAGNSWRDLGDSESTYQDSDEEGILRRRTMGLWLIPSNPVALLEPMTDLFPGELQSVVNTVNGPITGAITLVKKMLSDNPLNTILRAVKKLPIIGSIFDFQLPEWPAVRPAAYPRSVELRGDKLSGGSRNFSDYVNEQRSFKDRAR